MTRSTFRYVDHVVTRDPTGEVSWSAVCVSGDEADCGATTPEGADEEAAAKWMAEHHRDTGHKRFKRLFADYATVAVAGLTR